MSQTLRQYCDNNRLTARKFNVILEHVGLHVTENTVGSWISEKTKPNKQYWSAIYKATEGQVDIKAAPSIKTMDAVLLDMLQEQTRDILRVEKKIDRLIDRLL